MPSPKKPTPKPRPNKPVLKPSYQPRSGGSGAGDPDKPKRP